MLVRFPDYPDCVGLRKPRPEGARIPLNLWQTKLRTDVYLGASECDWPDFSWVSCDAYSGGGQSAVILMLLLLIYAAEDGEMCHW